MKKACAIAALMVCGSFLPVFASYASEPDELDIPRLVPHRDQEVRATMLAERSKIVISSLKIPSLQEEATTEKRSAPSAEPRDTLCELKGVMVFVEDIDSDVEEHGLTKSLLKKEVESRLRQADIPVLTVGKLLTHQANPISI